MKIAVTLIDHITRSVVTEDGRHMVLAMRDTEDNEIALGIPSEQITKFIDLWARALSDSEQIMHPGADPQAIIPVTWWNLFCGDPNGGFVLSLTFGSGGSLSFVLSQHMTSALRDTLMAHLLVWTAPDGIKRARMRSLQISDKGDRPWNKLAELGWTRRSTFSSFTG